MAEGNTPQDGTPTPGGGGQGGDGEAGNKGMNGDANEEKKYTQADIDRAVKERLARDRAGRAAQDKAHEDVIRRLQEQKDLSDAERAELKRQFDELQERNLTAEQISAKRLKEAQELRDKEMASAKAEQDRMRNLLVSTIKRNAIVETVGDRAYSTDQVVALLDSRVEVREVVGADRKPTGKFRIIFPYVSYSDDGAEITEELDIKAGVDRYLNENPNLLKANLVGGGAGTVQPTVDAHGMKVWKESDIAKMSAEDYAKNEPEINKAMREGRIIPISAGMSGR